VVGDLEEVTRVETKAQITSWEALSERNGMKQCIRKPRDWLGCETHKEENNVCGHHATKNTRPDLAFAVTHQHNEGQ
jgi:hypothetical protein